MKKKLTKITDVTIAILMLIAFFSFNIAIFTEGPINEFLLKLGSSSIFSIISCMFFYGFYVHPMKNKKNKK